MSTDKDKDVTGFELSPLPEDIVYNQALSAAKKELSALKEERQKIDGRIAKLEQTVKSLSAICEEQQSEIPPDLAIPADLASEDGSGMGLTDAIRKIFASRIGRELTPVEVRDLLEASGMDLSKYSSQMVPIHNTLKRLYDQGELARSKDEPTRYRWVSPWIRMMHTMNESARAIQAMRIPENFEVK